MFQRGVPTPYFVEHFYDPLMNALGAVSENGATLLLTAMGIDPGGRAIGANPIYAVAARLMGILLIGGSIEVEGHRVRMAHPSDVEMDLLADRQERVKLCVCRCSQL